MSNPYLLPPPSVVSFSGGRTSGYMLRMILDAHGGALPDGVKVVFCNTGKERHETLDFVERCSLEWGVPVTWLEYRFKSRIPVPTRDRDWATLDDEPDGERTRRWDRWYEATAAMRVERERLIAERKAANKKDRKKMQKPALLGIHTFVEVNYATASRCGEPFEEVIAARNMLPNVMARFCTVECKIRTTQRYLKSLGWEQWDNAIGFRADEPHRVAKLKTTNRHDNEEPHAPLYKAGVTKEQIHSWWDRQPFRLELQEHEGNCDLCFLKGAGKIRRAMRDRPGLAAWWVRMEAAAVRRGGPPRPGSQPFSCPLPQRSS